MVWTCAIIRTIFWIFTQPIDASDVTLSVFFRDIFGISGGDSNFYYFFVILGHFKLLFKLMNFRKI